MGRQVLTDYVQYIEEQAGLVAREEGYHSAASCRVLWMRHVLNLFDGEPNSEWFKCELKRQLYPSPPMDVPLQEIVERATDVLHPETLDASPGDMYVAKEKSMRQQF